MDTIIDAFFYGLYMDRELLEKMGMVPLEVKKARLEGYQIDFRGKVKLVPRHDQAVWGTIIKLSQSDLAKMYSSVATSAYKPQPATAITEEGEQVQVVFYNLPEDQNVEVNTAYLRILIGIIERVDLPATYIKELKQLLDESAVH